MTSLFVAWRPATPEQAGWMPVGRLGYDGALYRFCYTRGARKSGFRLFPQMQRIDQIYESTELFPLFANRLLSQSRPEYDSYLRWSGFDPESAPDPIVILGVTEGIRQTDAIEVFPCPVPDVNGCFDNKFFLHGIRWMAQSVIDRVGRLQNGDPLKLMADLQNTVDPRAVAVRTESDRTMLGYVPRYLARDVWSLVQKCDVDFIKLSVERVNQEAPFQNRLLCRMRACWPDGFEPCGDDEFLPVPKNVPARCEG